MFETPLLDRVKDASDTRHFSHAQLKQLADELRAETVRIVSNTGGHLGAGLGVVELTVALHHVFETPEDRLIWDVGHQSYPHKILTGRREAMHQLRQKDGIAGFTKRAESAYDPFGAGHSSTSISAGQGMAVGAALSGEKRNVVAVIGDGAMSAGMAYEALNNAGARDEKLIVILNDNEMSIAPAVGAMSAYLSRMVSSKGYHSLRNMAKKAVSKLPEAVERAAKLTEQYAKQLTMHHNFFEEMGFYYIGPLDGHNLEHLLPVLENVRDSEEAGPVLIHVVTEKGHGFESPETNAEKFHAVKRFDIATGVQQKSKPKATTFTAAFAKALIAEAALDKNLVGITAAMPSGTGMDAFGKAYPERMFDVGIAEQHAVTFAAGLACEGVKPFVAIYSTFLQRAYDQIVHDVAIQNLPVRFAIDRAGLVGQDGPTHAGAFDVAYLGCLPNFVLMAAADELELMHMTATAAAYDAGPIAFRYPRGEGQGLDLPARGEVLEIGKGRVVKEGTQIAILSYGARLAEALKAAENLDKQGLSTSVADARFAKPLDEALIDALAQNHSLLVLLEEGSMGGFNSFVLDYLNRKGHLSAGLNCLTICLPDSYIQQASPEEMLAEVGLDAAGIERKILEMVARDDAQHQSSLKITSETK